MLHLLINLQTLFLYGGVDFNGENNITNTPIFNSGIKLNELDVDNNLMLTTLLGIKPKLTIRWDVGEYGIENKKLYMIHPLTDLVDGAEFVLVKYRRRNGKKKKDSARFQWGKKRGYCVYSKYKGELYSGITMLEIEQNWILTKHYIDEDFGIALRIPNPEWPLEETEYKNGIYKGIPESFWTDISKIHVYYDKNYELGRNIGIGLK